MTLSADILVVEDDPTIGRLLHDIFTLGGGAVRVAPTADAAATQLRRAQPALMTLDLNMPGMSGEELLMRLREGPRAFPVIVITSQLPVRHEVRELAEAVVAKPFELSELIATVNRVAPGAITLGV